MKTKMFLIAAALFLFSGISFGQGFALSWYYYPEEFGLGGGPALGTGCPIGTGQAYGDDQWIEIRQDVNANGYDVDDPMPDLAVHNRQGWFFNGTADFESPGYFDMSSSGAFASIGIMPANPRYYLVIRFGNDNVHFYSPVTDMSSGLPQREVFLNGTDWTCLPGASVCVPNPAVVAFHRTPVPASQCAFLCPNDPTVVTVCPDPGAGPLDPTKTPILTVVPGCEPVVTNCDQQCPPLTAYQLIPIGYDAGCFYYSLTGAAEGCVCITLEGFLAASIESFTGVAGDGEVALTWVTLSETGVSSYAIARDGEVIASVPSVNSTSTQTYTYTDETAENGTSYTYTLRVINSDNTITETNLEVNATPSFGAAVVTEYALHQNFPNPFNPSTSISFDVVEKNLVTLKVFNAAGQEVGTVANGTFDSGRHIVSFSAANLPSGLYFYTVKIGNEFNATKKMLLVK